jgi:hypothetical protein
MLPMPALSNSETERAIDALTAAAPRLKWGRWQVTRTPDDKYIHGNRAIYIAQYDGFTVTVRFHDHRENDGVLDRWLPRPKLPKERHVWIDVAVRDELARYGRAAVLPTVTAVIGDELWPKFEALERLIAANAAPPRESRARLPAGVALAGFIDSLPAA